ncbi:hypothetical protein [Streptomyces cyaneofuscatus]|uniref:hypothetical protein n=1 Tax=Streptomyces cyaneofuscatus TaxID=66883 RepID=UPI00365CB428
MMPYARWLLRAAACTATTTGKAVHAQITRDVGITPLPLSGDGLPDRAERPGARLALLAARAPYRITAEDVAAWRVEPFTDHCLVHLVAFGAMLAVERVEAGMARA